MRTDAFRHFAVVCGLCAALLSPQYVCAGSSADSGGYTIDWSAGIIGGAGSGDFAPYYIASNRHGIVTSPYNALARVAAWRPVDYSRRFSYGFGVGFIGGYSSSDTYMRWRDDGWHANKQHPQRVWVQQLYGEVKYRGVFLTAGLKEHTSALLDASLSSGDLVESGNARPIPEVRVGFTDFQDIPFTNGWVQIQGEIAYGKPTDDAWLRDHYNYYNHHIHQGALYTYKRCYFRTKPSQPLSLTIGMQTAAFFGGETQWFRYGRYDGSRHFAKNLKQFFKVFIPVDGGQAYYTGSSLGSWDVVLRYRLRNGMTLRGYMQKPWEDGSGIGCLNGFDGLWGVELKTGRHGILTGAVVEYLDFTNQSGPMHWDPDDNAGTNLWHRAEGSDDYYNNHEFNAYAHYGMSIGSPFMKSPLYNLGGSIEYLNNRVRGFHIGIEGELGSGLTYRLLGGYRKSYGSGYVPLVDPVSETSVMAEATYAVPRVKGLTVKGQLGLDHGKLYGDNFGGCVTVIYHGVLRL